MGDNEHTMDRHHESNPWAKEAEENAPRRSNVVGMAWKQGDNTIRILPDPKGGLPFVKYTVHWIPMKTSRKNRPIIHDVKTRCPVCEYVSILWSEVYRLKEEEGKDDKSPEVQKLIKQINVFRGKKTYDMNIINREDYRTDDGKIKLKRLVAGPTIWKPIIELGNSSKWGNPSSAGPKGYDLTVTVDGEKMKREYTLLPDSERKALTEEEMAATNERAYDLVKLRVFSSPQDMIDVIENARPPLDTLNLKKLRKLTKTDGKTSDEDGPDEAHAASQDDDDDDNGPVATVVSHDNDVADDDDDEQESKGKEKEDKRDSKAFATDNEPAAEPEDADVDVDESEGKSDVQLKDMDCRGTYDSDDIGCQDCKLVDECNTLKHTFKTKAAELNIDISNVSGIEIEKLIKEKAKPVGKQGKQGKQSTGEEKPVEAPAQKRRSLPF